MRIKISQLEELANQTKRRELIGYLLDDRICILRYQDREWICFIYSRDYSTLFWSNISLQEVIRIGRIYYRIFLLELVWKESHIWEIELKNSKYYKEMEKIFGEQSQLSRLAYQITESQRVQYIERLTKLIDEKELKIRIVEG
jgi:hypothetical protein